ncbi:hypothetical protein [Halococcus sp. IIIV-5B]|uniref:hypothetical protein n=1 Tax=Halococcus sp. IIIV-5B TaxID=2321230 RepID=UPI000E74937C|nr:hypothetical protein [Halococcus sp. IIIV-5B]RJT07164.1 hypothetical protein D3261_03935 [Halococcus sp. IIIV-5B]
MSSLPTTLEEWIHREHRHQPSCEDQIFAGYWFFEQGVTDVAEEYARTSAVEDSIGHQLDHTVRDVLDNLEEIGVLRQRSPPGNGIYIRNHRTEENFFDPTNQDFIDLLTEEISRFIRDMQTQEQEEPLPTPDGDESDDEESSGTLRTIAADALDIEPSIVEEALTNPDDPVDRMNRYDTVLDAVKRSDTVSRNGDYDGMGWRNMALRWTLSKRGVRLEKNESLTRL